MFLLTSCEVRYRKDVVMLMMLLRRRCSYREDVVTLMMLLHRRWCYIEDVAMLKILFVRCCCVEHVATLKMLLSSRCCYVEDAAPPANAFKTALWMWRKTNRHVHFVLRAPNEIEHFAKRTQTMLWTRISTGFYWNSFKKKTKKTAQHKQNIIKLRTTQPTKYAVRFLNTFHVC